MVPSFETATEYSDLKNLKDRDEMEKRKKMKKENCRTKNGKWFFFFKYFSYQIHFKCGEVQNKIKTILFPKHPNFGFRINTYFSQRRPFSHSLLLEIACRKTQISSNDQKQNQNLLLASLAMVRVSLWFSSHQFSHHKAIIKCFQMQYEFAAVFFGWLVDFSVYFYEVNKKRRYSIVASILTFHPLFPIPLGIHSATIVFIATIPKY